jgi:hypothetical protein
MNNICEKCGQSHRAVLLCRASLGGSRSTPAKIAAALKREAEKRASRPCPVCESVGNHHPECTVQP